jgi:signal peptidase II
LKKAALVVFLVILFDQILKIWIKTHFYMGESVPVFRNWFFIHFTENEGMAYGMSLGGAYGKLLLSIFRIVAVTAIGWWLVRAIRRGAGTLLIVCISLVLAGALGNIIDSAFYGLIFSESTYMQMAQVFPEGGGYAGFLHGKVVDMLYFPILETRYPDWLPFVGGDEFIFFRPVFNIADSAITIGVLALILFQKKIFATVLKDPEETTEPL